MAILRLGVIGCGGMANVHSRGKDADDIKDMIKVTAVCDIVEERAKNAAVSWGAEHVFTNYKDMVDYVDAVLIVLPHDLHYECGMFFVNHKKHVLMEKPMCNSESECLSLMAAAEREGVVLMTAYPVRYWPEIIKMKEIADSGIYGKIVQMSIWTEQYTDPMQKYGEMTWGNTARLGGGQLFSHGCHYIDLLLWFLGKPIRGVHIGTKVGTPWLMEEGTSNVTIEFEGGALGYHFGTWGARGTKMGYDFQIHFEKALLTYNRHSGEFNVRQGMEKLITLDHGRQTREQTVTPLQLDVDPADKRTHLEIRHFADCILNNTKPITNAHDSLQGLRVIWKLYEAEKRNEVADLRGLELEQYSKE